MLRATVIGNVWSTKRLKEVPERRHAGNRTRGRQGHACSPSIVLGCGVGERVLVATGSVAAAWFPGKPPPIDALIIGSIDEPPAGRTAKK